MNLSDHQNFLLDETIKSMPMGDLSMIKERSLYVSSKIRGGLL